MHCSSSKLQTSPLCCTLVWRQITNRHSAFFCKSITLTGQIASSVCKCGKVCNNARGLKIHQARSKCGQQLQHEQRKGHHLSVTQEDSSQDNHHSTEDIQAHDEGADSQDPNLFDLLDEDSSNTDNDTQSREEPRRRQQPTTERKPGLKLPTQGDKKSWELFDGDLDTILNVALRGELDRKIRTLTAITYAVR